MTDQPTQGSLPKALQDLTVELSVRLGTSEMTIRELTKLAQGSIIALREGADRPLDLCANGRVVARGELEEVEEDGSLALKITETVDAA